MIAETRERFAKLRRKTQRTQAAREKWDKHTREEIEALGTFTQLQTSRLRELGTSLADIAAFMQEIELQQGFITSKFDGRGIERLRFLALQFEALGETVDNAANGSNAASNSGQGQEAKK